MRDFLKDYNELFNILADKYQIKIAFFDEDAYDQDADRPTYQDQYILSVCLKDNHLCIYTEEDGFTFSDIIDLTKMVSIVTGRDADVDALEYIFSEIVYYYINEEDGYIEYFNL